MKQGSSVMLSTTSPLSTSWWSLSSNHFFFVYSCLLIFLTCSLFIFPRAGPDIKYLLGFIRTQLSTSVTVALVFGPKIIRVLRGQGDQWDNRARSRGVTASFSLNGIGLVPEEAPDLYQENEELKEEIQKLAAQIEFMKIVHMEINNRHVKPKSGGYFTTLNAPTVVHSPLSRQGCLLSNKQPEELWRLRSCGEWIKLDLFDSKETRKPVFV